MSAAVPERHLGPIRPRIVVSNADTRELEIVAVRIGTTQSTVQIQGEVDLATAELLATTLDNELGSGHRFVRLDLSRVQFIDCAGLRVLADAHNRFLAARGTLVLTGLSPRLARLLDITHLDQALFVADGPGQPRRGRHLTALPTAHRPNR
jgi:anti-sigma B factor antagonist